METIPQNLIEPSIVAENATFGELKRKSDQYTDARSTVSIAMYCFRGASISFRPVSRLLSLHLNESVVGE
jgi:hypothetical protein